MKKSEWSDNELENLLSQMPKIKDHRDPRDIYQKLSIKANKRRRTVWIIPSVATAAAALLFFLLVPSIWQGENEKTKSDMAFETKMAETESNKMKKDENMTSITNDNAGTLSIATQNYETAIYNEDILAEEQEVLTYMVPDINAQILVPVSIVVPKEKKSWAELYQIYSEKLTEEQWGLSDFYPLNATLTMTDEHTLNVDVPVDHVYGDGSASETQFMKTLENMYHSNKQIQRITLSTNGNPGIMFGNSGELRELDFPEGKHTFYLFQPNNSNLPFLVPSQMHYKDIDSAFAAWFGNLEENYGLMSPHSFNFDIDTSAKPKLVVTVTDKTELPNEDAIIYAIEAILLTAKEFGFETIKIENVTTTQIGRFNLQEEIKVPVAANKVFIH